MVHECDSLKGKGNFLKSALLEGLPHSTVHDHLRKLSVKLQSGALIFISSLGASIERYNNVAWHEDCFEIIFKIFPLPQLCGKMLGLISIAKAQVHLDCQ